MTMNRNCKRARESVHNGRTLGPRDYKIAIAGAEEKIRRLMKFHARELAKPVTDHDLVQRIVAAVKVHEGNIAAWRAKIAELVEARAAATTRTRENRLQRAADKRTRKAQRRIQERAR